MKFRLLMVGLLLAGTALAAPQFPIIRSSTPLSLDSLISLGYQYNPSVRQAGLNQRLNKIGRLNAIGQFLPTFSVGAGFSQTHYKSPTFVNPNGTVSTFPVTMQQTDVEWDSTSPTGELFNPRLVTRTITEPVPSGNNRSSSESISLNESLFEGGRRFFLYKQAKIQIDLNNLSVEDAQKALAGQIAQQMVLVITQEKLLELSRHLRDQQQDAYNLAKARFDVGAVTELDVMQAEISLNQAENAISSNERALQTQKQALNQTLGIDIQSEFPVDEVTSVTPYKFNVDSLVAVAYGSRTDLAISRLAVERQRQSVNMQYSNYLPNVSLGATFSKSEASGTNVGWTLNPRDVRNIYSLNLSWNIFDGFSREYNLQTQRVALARAEEDNRALRLSLDRNVRDAYANLENAFNQLQITGRNRDLAERRLNLERERYRLGAASQLELRDAQVVYAQAETENLQQVLSYQSNLVALELAIGKPLR
jgi:outer membrane protein